jgi:predicted signal transduction protein with EAL and GGDEF domain
LGGDEFVILQADVHIGDSSDCLASRVIAEIGKPYAIEGQEIVIGASIGISLAGPGCDSVDDLLKNADMALYAAKDDGRSVWRFFKREMEVAARTRRETEIDLRRALDQGEFSVFFQPIVNTDSGKVVCCEALVRWFHPQRGMIPPCQFIELAERTGMIVELGGVILAKACKAAMKWPEDISVAVNLSAVQFQRGVVIEQVMTALVKSGLPAKRLEVEITESLALRDMRATKQVLEQLRGVGVKVALDDFGTGYSSLSYLNQIPFDKIKIDRSFVLAIHENKMSRSLIGMVSNLAKTMDREMVVEGVETEDDLAVLRDLGVRDIQGYLFSKPRPSGELMDMLEKGVAKSAPVKFRVVA